MEELDKRLFPNFSGRQNSNSNKSREQVFLCFVPLFPRCVDKSRERLFNKRLVSSGDAFLTPKRENTVSPILFHLNTGDKIGGRERGKEGKEAEIMRQSQRKTREGGMQD